MSDLVLFTNQFPFLKGEYFLEDEIPYLAGQFDQVHIVPIRVPADAGPARDLPQNVLIAPGRTAPFTTADHVAMARRGNALVNKSEGAPPAVRHPVRRLYDGYFQARADRIAQQILGPLGQHLDEKAGPVAVTYSYWFFLTAAVAARARRELPRLAGTAFVSRGHRYDVDVDASPLHYLPARRTMLDQVDHLYPVSDLITERLRGEYPESAGKIATRRLGAIGPGDPIERTRGDAALQVLTCSSLLPVKRLDRIADAIARLARNGTAIHWTHIGGDGSKADQAQLDALRRRAGDTVFTATGPLPHAGVLEVLARPRWDVFLNASASEGVPVSVMEALGASLPVVATDVGGTGELVRDGLNGRLLAADATAADLAGALAEIAGADPRAYRELSRAARSTWETRCAPDECYGGFAAELAAM